MRKKLCHERIAIALVENAINDGFLISVSGEQMVVDRSRNFAEITKAMFSTDIDTLTLNVEERRVGIIKLTYGDGSNGLGVISDHTDVPHINRLVEHTLKELEPSSTPNLQGPDEPSIGNAGWKKGVPMLIFAQTADPPTMEITGDQPGMNLLELTQTCH